MVDGICLAERRMGVLLRLPLIASRRGSRWTRHALAQPRVGVSPDTVARQSDLKGVPMSLIAILIVVAIIALAVFIVRRVA